MAEDTHAVPDRSSRHAITRLESGCWAQAMDELAEEVPVAFEYNGISHAVMLATPSDLEEFALGFSLSEGIIARPDELYDTEIVPSEAGITLRIRIASAAAVALKERRRNLTGRTGCGLCGTESLAQVLRPLPHLRRERALSASAIWRALAGLKAFQPLNQTTGATHAAAWCAQDGALLAVCEDVGRHNALDKMIGSVARKGADFGAGFALVTSRASVEMVQKSASVGITALVAISAPTALAVRTARDCGMTLVAFARASNFVNYSAAGAIELD